MLAADELANYYSQQTNTTAIIARVQRRPGTSITYIAGNNDGITYRQANRTQKEENKKER